MWFLGHHNHAGQKAHRRRLHDTGRSGRWLLIGLTPAIGEIAFLVFLLQDSDLDTHQCDPSPKHGGSATAEMHAQQAHEGKGHI
ncbi:MAG: DUF805 domain-containing protein [Firmicutes bacterium]|jgi:hypothetical protein|nr:DUF805 domain-containing protein [Bacillota bacterium]